MIRRRQLVQAALAALAALAAIGPMGVLGQAPARVARVAALSLACSLALAPAPSAAIAPVLLLLIKQIAKDAAQSMLKDLVLSTLTGMGCKGMAIANALQSLDLRKGGGGGIPGVEAARAAAPDGYTFLVATSGVFGVNPSLYPDLPYRPLVDFLPITNIFLVPLVIVAHPSFQANTLAELIELARKEPGQLSYASAGPGTSQHLSMELFKMRAKLDIDAVAGAAETPEEAAEIYAASLLAIDIDNAAERGYLAMLAARLKLDDALVAHLQQTVAAAAGKVAQPAG